MIFNDCMDWDQKQNLKITWIIEDFKAFSSLVILIQLDVKIHNVLKYLVHNQLLTCNFTSSWLVKASHSLTCFLEAGLLWPMINRCQKCSNIWKVTSGCWAEIGNVKKIQTSGFSISALPSDGTFRCHCSFCIHGPLVKKASYIFLKLFKIIQKIFWTQV